MIRYDTARRDASGMKMDKKSRVAIGDAVWSTVDEDRKARAKGIEGMDR